MEPVVNISPLSAFLEFLKRGVDILSELIYVDNECIYLFLFCPFRISFRVTLIQFIIRQLIVSTMLLFIKSL